MKIFRWVLIFCLPAFLLHSVPYSSSRKSDRIYEKQRKVFLPYDSKGMINPWSYFEAHNIASHSKGYINHFFDFVDLLCQEEFVEQLSDEEFYRVFHFVTWAVRNSVPKSRPDLKEQFELEIEELTSLLFDETEKAWESLLYRDEFFLGWGGVYSQERDPFFCKKKAGWFSRKWHHFTHWVDKHKKPIIITGAVAIGIGIALLTKDPNTGVAVGGTLASLGAAEPPEHVNKPGEVYFREEPPEPPQASPPITQVEPTPPLIHPPLQSSSALNAPPSHLDDTNEQSLCNASIEEVAVEIEEAADLIREELFISPVEAPSGEEEKTFWEEVKEGVRDTVSYFTHEASDAVLSVASPFYDTDEVADNVHQSIDEVFETDFSSEYTKEFKEEVACLNERLGTDIAVGELPPPTTPGGAVARTGSAIGTAIVAQEAASVVNAVSNAAAQPPSLSFDDREIPISELAEAGKASDRGELTKAGRALAKHGSRPGSVFPLPMGTPVQINEQGQAMLESILNDPNKNVIQLPSGNIKIYNELGQGAHFTSDRCVA